MKRRDFLKGAAAATASTIATGHVHSAGLKSDYQEKAIRRDQAIAAPLIKRGEEVVLINASEIQLVGRTLFNP